MSKARREHQRNADDVEGHDFVPLHCPNRRCREYSPSPSFAWRRYGSFRRPSDGRRFQCFRCAQCHRRFSIRTFAGDYWLRRRDLFPRILSWSNEGPGLRQMARVLVTHHTTVMRHLARGGRQALVYHYERLRAHVPREPLALDGFESFEYSQFFPFHLNLAAGRQSWFLYAFTESPLRRKGRMTAAQKRRRAELEQKLGRPDPKAVETGMATLLELVFRAVAAERRSLPSASSAVFPPCPTVRLRGPDPTGPHRQIHTDDHPAYRRAIQRYARETSHRLRHIVTPGAAPRTTNNPLFAVNLADLLLRHSHASHRRETIAFCKRRQSAIERAALFLLWRNDVKPRKEKEAGITAAMFAGVASAPLAWNEFVLARRFPRRSDLPGPTWSFYWARIKTAIFGARQRTHRLRYAF